MKPLVNKKYQLEKFPGKGGWTFAQIPEIEQDKSKPFGSVKVSGTIDGYSINNFHLMPMGNGKLLLPVKSELRKKIKKNAGDIVHVVLYADSEPIEIPKEMLECLKDEPKALTFFNSLNEAEKNAYIKWIFSTKSKEKKVERLAKTVNRLLDGLKFHNKL